MALVVTETIRIQNNEVPILILSAKNTSADRVLGLKKGADDYMVKPFNLEELLLRVDKLILKNKKLLDKETVGDTYEFGNNKIDFKAQVAITWNKEQIELSKKEVMLLKLLIENKNEVVTREKILQSVWGYNVYPTTRTIDNFILNFRKYFEKDSRNPKFFHSVRGVGYKYSEQSYCIKISTAPYPFGLLRRNSSPSNSHSNSIAFSRCCMASSIE